MDVLSTSHSFLLMLSIFNHLLTRGSDEVGVTRRPMGQMVTKSFVIIELE